jgi:hypothetical protein
MGHLTRRFHLALLEDFLAANEWEEVPATALLELALFYPDPSPGSGQAQRLDAVAADAGLGYHVFLHAAYTLGAKRVVDLRAHSTEKTRQSGRFAAMDARTYLTAASSMWESALPMAPSVWYVTCRWAHRPGNVSTIELAMPPKPAMPLSSTGSSSACRCMAGCGARPSPTSPRFCFEHPDGR